MSHPWANEQSFYDLDPESRGAVMEIAEDRSGQSWYDMDPQERADAMDRAIQEFWP